MCRQGPSLLPKSPSLGKPQAMGGWSSSPHGLPNGVAFAAHPKSGAQVLLLLHQLQIRVGRCSPRCCRVFAVQVLMLLWLHHTPDGDTSCVSVTAVPARAQTPRTRVYSPCFVISHTRVFFSQKGQYWATGAPRWMLPLGRHPGEVASFVAPTKAGKSHISPGSPNTSPLISSHER